MKRSVGAPESTRTASTPLRRVPESQAGSHRRWTINGDFAALKPTGVARYASEVTAALDELVSEGHPLTRDLSISLVAPVDPRRLSLASIPVRVVPDIKPRLPQVWVQALLPRHVRGGLLSFCNLAPVAIRKHVVCVHDMHTELEPGSYPVGFRLAHRIIIPWLGRRAAALTTVSDFSRSHIVGLGAAPAHKVSVTFNGSDHVQRWDAGRSGLALPTPRPFVFGFSQAQSYKNVALLRNLAPHLAEHGIDLVVVGPPEHFGDACGPSVHLVGRVADDDLALLFSKALCLAFPSRLEGFGLPAVEAMALGCPVVVSDSACLPEICGEAALYADPDRVEDWARAIQMMHADPKRREQLIAAGKLRAARYQWRRVAESYLELMASLDAAD